MKQVISLDNGIKLTLEVETDQPITEKVVSKMIQSIDFVPVTQKDIKTKALEMAKRDEGVIQDEVAVELGFIEKNRGTGVFNSLEKSGRLIKTGEKRVSLRTGFAGNVYKAA